MRTTPRAERDNHAVAITAWSKREDDYETIRCETIRCDLTRHGMRRAKMIQPHGKINLIIVRSGNGPAKTMCQQIIGALISIWRKGTSSVRE
mmetsp:Transcript_20862/g.58019  ORF Transcript_20862/g.58019 Transcript_20862/m.58019 type:complete len:92 (-) Transcript_20862:1122-1397(-)